MIYTKKVKIVKNFHLNLDISSNTIKSPVIYPKLGDEVSPDEVIAKVYRSEEVLELDLMSELEIHSIKSQKEINKYLNVVDGQVVQKGMIIGHKSSIASENIIKAPFDAIVEYKLPSIVLKSIPVEIDIKSFVNGKIIKIEKSKIVIETNILRIFPAFSQGQSIYGPVKKLSNIDSLDETFKNKVIFFNGMASQKMLEKALSVGSHGIVAISCTSDILSTNMENFTLVSLEGFGQIPIDIYSKIDQSDDKIIFIDTDKNELIIGTDLEIEDLKDVYIKELVLNDTLQIFDNDNYARVGKVKKVYDYNCDIDIGDGNIVMVDKLNLMGILN